MGESEQCISPKAQVAWKRQHSCKKGNLLVVSALHTPQSNRAAYLRCMPGFHHLRVLLAKVSIFSLTFVFALQGSRPVQVLVNNAKIHRPVEAPKSTSDHKRDSPSLVCAARTKTRALGNSSSCPKKGNGSSCPKKGNQARNFPISFSNIDSVMRFAEVSIPVPRSAHRGLCWPHPNPNTNTDATASQQPRSAYHSLNQRPEPKPPADSFGPTWHGKSPHVIIVWFRQDLRLDDNPALHAAVHSLKSANGKNGKNGKNSKNGKNGPKPMIVPLFVQPTDDEEGGWPCRGAAAFWLDQSLRA